MQTVNPDETACSVFDRLKPLFASVDISKFQDGMVHFRNSGMKELEVVEGIFMKLCIGIKHGSNDAQRARLHC